MLERAKRQLQVQNDILPFIIQISRAMTDMLHVTRVTWRYCVAIHREYDSAAHLLTIIVCILYHMRWQLSRMKVYHLDGNGYGNVCVRD